MIQFAASVSDATHFHGEERQLTALLMVTTTKSQQLQCFHWGEQDFNADIQTIGRSQHMQQQCINDRLQSMMRETNASLQKKYAVPKY